MKSLRQLIAVTMGDPAGIGPEICLKAACRDQPDNFVPIIFGDARVLRIVAEKCRIHFPPVVCTWTQVLDATEREPVVIFDLPSKDDIVKPGQVSAATGAASYRYILAAIDAALAGKVAAVVTGPIHKEALHQAGIPYPGHTEIFAAMTQSDRACMMLTSRELSCSFVTTHVGYHEVPNLLSQQRILDVIELTHEAMLQIKNHPPRLVICGLNPHAGEHGLFGNREEERFIIPAVEQARSRGILIEGPLPPDTAFLPTRRKQTDCFMALPQNLWVDFCKNRKMRSVSLYRTRWAMTHLVV